MVVFTSEPVDGDRIRSAAGSTPTAGDQARDGSTPVELPAYFLQVRGHAPGSASAPHGALDAMGLEARRPPGCCSTRGI